MQGMLALSCLVGDLKTYAEKTMPIAQTNYCCDIKTNALSCKTQDSGQDSSGVGHGANDLAPAADDDASAAMGLDAGADFVRAHWPHQPIGGHRYRRAGERDGWACAFTFTTPASFLAAQSAR